MYLEVNYFSGKIRLASGRVFNRRHRLFSEIRPEEVSRGALEGGGKELFHGLAHVVSSAHLS